MKKAIVFLLCLNILYYSACATDSADEEQITHQIGTGWLAGVKLRFIFDLNKIQLVNRNNTVIKCRVKNLSTNSILVDDLITWPGSTDNKEKLSFAKGERIEISVWQGYTSVFYGDLFGQGPDYIEQAILQEGTITVFPVNLNQGYTVILPNINGALCELSGQYALADPLNQLNNFLYCDNVSTDLLEIELYVLKPISGGYEADFEIASFLVYFEDVKQINYIYDIPEDLALRITSIDKEEIYGCTLNITAQTCAKISAPITLP